MCCFEFLLGPSKFRRTFDGDRPKPPQATVDFASKYIVPQEVYDKDEAEKLNEILETELAALQKQIPKGCGVMNADSSDIRDLDAGFPMGLLHGKVIINNTAGLPEECRVGLFKKDATLTCVGRLSEVSNIEADLHFAGLALKILVPDSVPNYYAENGSGNEVDLLFREVNAIKDSPEYNRFFINNGLEFRLFQYIGAQDMSFMKDPKNWGLFFDLLGRLKTSKLEEGGKLSRSTGYPGKSWGGLAPFRLGPGVCKYYAIPAQDDSIPLIGGKKPSSWTEVGSGLKNAFDKSKPFKYDLYVQVATKDCVEKMDGQSPEVVAAECAWAKWDATKAPSIKVGSIEFPANALFSDELVPGHKAPLQFSAFNTYPEMEPIGQVMRFRKEVHVKRSNLRVERQFGIQGGATVGKCPFLSMGSGFEPHAMKRSV